MESPMSRPPCLIIGAGPGIGQACALAFARLGHDVALATRNPERLQQACSTIHNASGQRALAYGVDAAHSSSLETLVRSVTADLGEPGVVIYNAASTHRGRPTTVDAEAWMEDYKTNVVGAVMTAQLVAPAMKARGGGTILLTGGGFAYEPSAGFASLSAGKAALRNLTYTLAQELGAHGIHVATVTVYGVVQTGTAFDPQRIAAEFVRLHRQPRGRFETETVYK